MTDTKSGLVFRSEANPSSRFYIAPRLERLGDIRDITMGPSLGGTDSKGLTSLSEGSGFAPSGPSAGPGIKLD